MPGPQLQPAAHARHSLDGSASVVAIFRLGQHMARPAASRTTSHTPHTKTPATTPSEDVAQPTAVYSQASDFMAARAIAAAVRATHGVVDLSPGLLALVATYGATERVVGVVVRHPVPRDTVVEVHVVVATGTVEAGPETEMREGDSDMPTRASASGASAAGAVLTRVADEVRRAVYRAVQELGLAPPSAVDVLIDDIRLPG